MPDTFSQDRLVLELLDPSGRQSESATAFTDRGLIEQCLEGDPAAWETMYRQCQPTVLRRIKALLGRASSDADIVQEIAARVWHSVVCKELSVLAKFDPGRRCRLPTYLAAIAEKEMLRFLRTERREKERALRRIDVGQGSNSVNPGHLDLDLDEFLALLSRREREFCENCLLSIGNQEFCERHYTPQNAWQLRHRIRLKLQKFANP